MNIIGDLHCHTTASVHAYSSLRENINAAIQKGLYALAITDHGPGTPDGASVSYFENLTSLPLRIQNLRLVRGIEANIMDYEGTLDVDDCILQHLDYVIASYHSSCTEPGTIEDHTRAYLAVARNPHVDVIGHSGTPEFAYDYETVIPVFKKYNKVVEINAHTFICRQKSIDNCKKIAMLCRQHEVPVLVNSDAHSEFEVGEFQRAIHMLEEMNFPESLVINANLERMNQFLDGLAE